MDRNNQLRKILAMLDKVALLAEGVDRNLTKENRTGGGFKVALLAEGVDRNRVELDAGGDAIQSPSSRRAWIEIMMP